MIKTLARVYKWTPDKIEGLYFDEVDYNGIVYWWKDAKEYIKEISKSGGLGL